MKMLDVPTALFDPATRVTHAVAQDAASIALSALPTGQFATIHAVLPADNDADADLVMRLIEIGFIPGERVRVVAVGHPGRQPLAVRLAAADSGRANLSGATFAMRRHEADFIRVVPDVAAS
jgi:ferrous iron transport protein A